MSGRFPGFLKDFRLVWKLSGLSVNFLNCLEILLDCMDFFSSNACKLSGLSESFQSIWKLSGLSEIWPAILNDFWLVRDLSGKSENFPDSLENFQTYQKVPRHAVNLPEELETFQTIRKISSLTETARQSSTFPDFPKKNPAYGRH